MAEDAVAATRAALDQDKPLRVWSLIVTIFGDVVMRQGRDLAPGPIWVAPLTELIERLGVEPGLVRTSLSRLTANGALARGKAGRNTFYALTPAAAAEFSQAAELIYGRRALAPATGLSVALIDRSADRAAARAALEAQGFRFFAPSAALAPERPREPPPAGTLIARATEQADYVEIARALYRIDALQTAYLDFIGRFAPWAEARLEPEAAILLRVVAVHRWRRLALRDPGLPREALPADWAGGRAEAIFLRLIAALEPASERWLAGRGFRDGQAA